jgi:hypothetical protein
MDEKVWAAQDSKIEGIRDIKVTTEYLSPDYAPPSDSEAVRTSNRGRLVLLRIQPKNSQRLPSFCARWDHKEQCVDVDLEGNPREGHKFKHGKPGYRGHKTRLVTEPGGPRKYAIEIETPSTGAVFKGTLAMKADFSLNLRAGMYLIAGFEASATVVTP